MQTKKLFLSFLTLFILTAGIFADIPSGYYDSADGLTGDALKNALHNIIDGHTSIGYDPAKEQMFGYIDNEGGQVRGVYTGEYYSIPYGAQLEQINQNTFNCEHTLPQSWFNYASTPKADLFHLYPTFSTVNSSRGNMPFGDVTSIDNTYGSGEWMSKRGDNSTGVQCWEPGDPHKGNVARAILYMLVRYEYNINSMAGYDMVSVMLDWHAIDAPDTREIQRNDDIYELQNNRNPFIDHPEWVSAIWGGGEDTYPPSISSVTALSETTVKVSFNEDVDETTAENTSNYSISSKLAITSAVLQANGSDVVLTTGTQTPSTVYTLTVTGVEDLHDNAISSADETFTGYDPSSGGDTDDLFISEYIEGSSNNKAVEIFNGTGSEVNLAAYTIQVAHNGGDWAKAKSISMSGMLADNDVYVICNSSADAAVQSVSDDQTGSLDFNGNDAVGLFKNSSVIDVVGNQGESTEWSVAGVSSATKDHTIVRKSSISSGNTDWTSSAGTNETDSEWTVYDIDTFTDLGTHTFSGGSGGEETLNVTPINQSVSSAAGTTDFSISSNINWSASDDADWITLSESEGSGNGTVTASYSENTAPSQRVGTITVSSLKNGIKITKQVTVTQSASANSLEISPTSTSVGYMSGTADFLITTIADWSASDDADWITLSESEGSGNGTVTASYTENTSASSRTGTITVSTLKNGVKIETTAQITQSAASSGGSVFISQYIEGGGYNKAIEIYNGTGSSLDLTGYKIKVAFNGGDWQETKLDLSGTVAAGDVYVLSHTSADAQTILDESDIQNNIINFNGDDAIGIFQGTTLLDIIGIQGTDPGSSWTVAGDASGAVNHTLVRKETVTQGNTDWTSSAGTNETDSEWTILPQDDYTGLGSHTTTGGGETLDISPSNQSVGTAAGSTDFSITSSTAWSASDNADWITLSESKGSGNGTITAAYTENTSVSQRVGTITVTTVKNGVKVTAQAAVTQAGVSESIDISPSNQSVGTASGSVDFSVTSNTAWSATDNADWITLSESKGSGNGTVTAAFTENSSSSQRVGTITVTTVKNGVKVTAQAAVTQAGVSETLSVTPSVHNVPSSAGNADFSVTSNTGWTVSDDAAWITLSESKNKGTGNGTVTATYTENTSTSQRTGTISFSTVKNGEKVTLDVTVVQAGTASGDPFGDPVVYPNNTMAVYGQVFVDGSAAASGDVVAAYAGTELRGKQSVVIHDGNSYVTLLVQVNTNGETITFKVYDSSEAEVLDASETTTAVSGGTEGSADDYFEITAGSGITQSLELNSGWNLISFNVLPSDTSPASVFSGLISSGYLEQVKNLSETYDPDQPAFLNTLSEIELGIGYWMNVNTSCTLTVTGTDGSSQVIQLNSGWNLMGYTKQTGMAIETALADIISYVEEVKATDGVYDPDNPAFLNTLTNLEPDEGYWIKVTEACSFTYPSKGSLGKDSGGADLEGVQILPGSMVIYGELSGVTCDVVEIYSGSELRGRTEIIHHMGREYFTLQAFTVSDGEELEIFAVNGVEREWLGSAASEIHGTVGADKPEIFGFSGSDIPLAFEVKVSPNPFNPAAVMELMLPEPGNVRVKIFDISGRLVREISGGYCEAGVKSLEINLDGHSSGLYFARVVTDTGFRAVKRLMLVK